jgi:hypothetical protein
MGPSGNDEPAALVLVKVFGDIRAAGGPGSAVTAASLEASINKALNFMTDTKNGLPHFVQLIKSRSK